MKIMFLCGSLERGKDGVGDYTRLLAKEISSYGHPVIIISINDKAASEAIVEETNTDINFLITRSNALNNKSQFADIKKTITGFQPHIISLQYVPYSFSSYGTPLFLGKQLRNIYTRASWHIMVHEPFLSKENNSFKNTIIRQLQISSLNVIKHNLKPIIWHTSNAYYQQRIKKNIHVPCEILGLFGNIPIVNFQNDEQVKNAAGTFTAVYFGAVPQPKHHKVIAEKLNSQLKKLDIVLEIIFCGKGGTNEQQFHQAIKNALEATPHSVSFMGQLAAKELSLLFSSANFGIARVPAYLLGKSGSAIAMLEHGLPLWIPISTNESMIEDTDFRPGLCYTELDKIVALRVKKTQFKRLPVIANTFLTDLAGE